MPPRPAYHLLPRSFASSQLSSSNHIWISDCQLQKAFDRFAHTVHKRYGSNVPGPLEAQRRWAKRKMPGLTMHAPPLLDFGSLFGTNINDADWRAHHPLVENRFSTREPPLLPPQHRKVTTDRREDKREPLLQALFGRRQGDDQDEDQDGMSEKASLLNNLSIPDDRTLHDRFPKGAVDSNVYDIICFLRTHIETRMDLGKHVLLEFLDLTKKKEVWESCFRQYTSCVQHALLLGTLDLNNLNILLDRIGPWIEGRWSESSRRTSMELALSKVWVGLRECRIQIPDSTLLHKLRLMADSVVSPTSKFSRYIFELYRACWPLPGVQFHDEVDTPATVIYWLDLCCQNEKAPGNENEGPVFRSAELVTALHHLCRNIYTYRPVPIHIVITGDHEDASGLYDDLSTDIQLITQKLCYDTFLESREPTKADHVNFVRRESWFRALAQTESWRGSIDHRCTISFHAAASDGSKDQFYQCPPLWFDVFNEVCRYLPLPSAVRCMPDLRPLDFCRLGLIFSFGPMSDGSRLGIVPLPRVIEEDIPRFRRIASMFELSLETQSAEVKNSEYLLLLTAFKFNRPREGTLEWFLLIPALRITNLMKEIEGEAAVLDFLLSPTLHHIFADEESDSGIAISRLLFLLKVATEAYGLENYTNRHNEFVRRFWKHIVEDDSHWPIRWNMRRQFPESVTIHRKRTRNSYDRLLSHLALHAASDERLTDLQAWMMVDFLRMQLLQHKLLLLTDIHEAIVRSALIRPMINGNGIATARVLWVLNILRQSGMPRHQVKDIEALMSAWHQDLCQVRAQQKSLAHLDSQGSPTPEE